MKWSEFFSSAIKGAQDAGITIEADTPSTQEQAVVTTPETAARPAPDDLAIKGEMEAQRTALAAAQAEIATLQAQARAARLAALAQGWHGETAGHITIMEALGEGSEAFQAYVQQARANTEALRQSALFASAGTDRTTAGGSAWAKIESAARKVAAEQRMSVEQATVQVMDSDPALYREYLAEQQS